MATITMDDILAQAADAGAMTAKGADGMMHLAKICFVGARAKQVIGGKEGNLYAIYKAYLGPASKSEYGSRVDVKNDKALKYGVAKLNAFVKYAAQPGKTDANWDLVRQSVRVLNEDASKKDGGEKKIVSRYEQVLKVVRHANAIKKTKLSDADIRDALAPAEPTGDLEFKALERMLTAAKKLQDAAPVDKSGFFGPIVAEIEAQIASYKVAFPQGDTPSENGDDEDETDLEAMMSEIDPTLQAA